MWPMFSLFPKGNPNRRILFELLLLLILGIIAYIFSASHNLFERFVLFSRSHEHWNLDEISVAAVILLLGVGFFAMKRWRDLHIQIVHRRKISQIMRNYAFELERNNQELQGLLKIISHDLQEPLRKIQIMGERLSYDHGKSSSPEGRELLERILRAAGNLQEKLNDLRVYTSIMVGRPDITPVDLKKTADYVIRRLEPKMVRRGGIIDTGELHTIPANEKLISQLLFHLTDNALNFAGRNRSPSVRIFGFHSPKQKGKTGEYDDTYNLVVEDNGPGFDPKYARRIFGLFQKLDAGNQSIGSGMGLALCKLIAEKHGGRIEAGSAESEGSRFTVTLPLHRDEE